jgi:hypothetical protein
MWMRVDSRMAHWTVQAARPTLLADADRSERRGARGLRGADGAGAARAPGAR